MSRNKHKAIFLDRDGTVIRQVELLHRREDMRLLPHAAEALHAFRELGFLLILVTNQPVVARGIISEAGVEALHGELQRRLARHGAAFDAIYICPHHPNATLPQFRVTCDCRKPEPGLIRRAVKEWDIDLKRSFLIGDSTRDTLAGNRAKLATILVQTGHKGKDVWQFEGKPDFVARNLLEAVRSIKAHGAY